MTNPKISRYPGIRSFETDERELFFGRKKETQELFSLIKVKRSVVLFAKSGIGKTSLLNAGVIPLLTEDIYYPIKVRFQHTGLSPAEMLRTAVEKLAEDVWLKKFGEERLQRMVQGRQPLLWEYLKAYGFEKKLNITPILIFDQFEEFFMHSPEHQQEFADCLADIIYGRTPKQILSEQASAITVGDDLFDLPELNEGNALSEEEIEWQKPLDWKVVISLRSDRLSLLDNLSKTIPAILDNRYQLHPLGQEQALEAIVQPSQLNEDHFISPCFEYTPETLSIIQDNLSNQNGEIESFQLQIICQHIEHQIVERDKAEDHLQWLVTHDYLGGAVGIQSILNDYYEQRIAMIGNEKEQMQVRKLIEESLIVEGARVSLAETILLNRYKIPAELLWRLLNTRLIRVENTHLGRAYEVAHDTLVAPILKSYQERSQREQQEREERERQAALAKEMELRRQAQAKEEEMRKQINRQRRIIIGFVLLGGLMAAAFIFALWQWRVANETSSKLEKSNVQLEQNAHTLQAQKDSLKSSEQRFIQQVHIQNKLLEQLGIAAKQDSVQKRDLSAKNRALQQKQEALLKEQLANKKLTTQIIQAQCLRWINDGDVYFNAQEYSLALECYRYAESWRTDEAINALVVEKIKKTQEAMD